MCSDLKHTNKCLVFKLSLNKSYKNRISNTLLGVFQLAQVDESVLQLAQVHGSVLQLAHVHESVL